MKTANHQPIHRATAGVVTHCRTRRITLYLEPEDFFKVLDRAEATGQGYSSVARAIIKAWCDGEPPPIFVGVGEHS